MRTLHDASELLAALDASDAPAGSWVASDADGTLWAADAAEIAWHAVVAQRRIKPQAAGCLRGILAKAGGRPTGDPHGDAQAIFALYLQDRIDDWGVLAAMTACYAGWTLAEVGAWGRELYRAKLLPRVYETTRPVLAGIRERGFALCVITGSPWFLVEQALGLLGFPDVPVLGVGLELDGEVLLDEVIQPVPWEDGKVACWRDYTRQTATEGELVMACGDTFGDLRLLEAAQRLRVLVHPRPALRRRAASAAGPWCEFAPRRTADGQAVIPPSTDRVLEVEA